MSRTFMVVNRFTRTSADQTTALLLAEAARRGEAHVLDVDAVSLEPSGEVAVQARRVVPTGSVEEQLAATRDRSTEPCTLGEGDVLLIRTNPAREPERAWAHASLLDLAAQAQARGCLVLNDPSGLARARTKLYLGQMPRDCRPETLVTRDEGRIRRFLADAPGDVILKPLLGTRGRDVFRVDPHDPRNLSQIVDVLTREGLAMVQHFVPEATAGDLRVVLLDGQVLAVDGKEAVVRRVPPGHDFRSNVAIGGRPEPGTLTEAQRRSSLAMGEQLVRDGIFLAGLDLIGDVAVEINVFSTGGLGDAGAFQGVDFIPPVLDAVAARLAPG